ncbi:uncharacterized protein [Nerophis lumbriciformis]|uniref:uncharacterized protein n=1 Tax=Nerophis lumbriciformis TaxID=546530 RepID=UPI003BACB6A5
MRRDLYFEGELLSPLVSGRLRTTVRRPLVYTRDSFACFSAPSLVFLPTKCLGNIAPWMSGAQFGDPKELRPVALGEAPFGIRLYDSRPDGRPPVSEKMLHQAPWMSGAQFGDPKELRPVALGEAPFGIRLYDSRPDGRPPVSEKMLNQTMKGLDFSACQIGSDRRCATRTGHGEPVGPDHSLEFRRHKSRLERGPVGGRGRVTRGHHRRKPPLLFFIPKVDQERRGGRGSPW